MAFRHGLGLVALASLLAAPAPELVVSAGHRRSALSRRLRRTLCRDRRRVECRADRHGKRLTAARLPQGDSRSGHARQTRDSGRCEHQRNRMESGRTAGRYRRRRRHAATLGRGWWATALFSLYPRCGQRLAPRLARRTPRRQRDGTGAPRRVAQGEHVGMDDALTRRHRVPDLWMARR
jgi:hypothetical protein